LLPLFDLATLIASASPLDTHPLIRFHHSTDPDSSSSSTEILIMLEIKIQCACGQRFKFDVEPVHGRMPFVVNCPICGLDGTEAANDVLRQVTPAPVPVPLASPALVPAQSAAVASSPPISPSALRIHKTNSPPVEPEVPSPAPAASIPGPGTNPLARRAQAQAEAAMHAQNPGKKPSFALGFVGAIVGALIGASIYYLIFNYTGFRLKLLAVGVGYLAGFGAELLGRKEGSKELGVIAAVLTLGAIAGAQYLVAKNWWNSGSETRASAAVSAYDERVAVAKKVVAAIPTGSDQEIRIYLASDELEPGEKPDPASVTAEEIAAYRETVLPEMRDIASGKLTREAFDENTKKEEALAKSEQLSDEGTFKAVFLLLLLGKFNLISMAAAAGLAFKLCSNA